MLVHPELWWDMQCNFWLGLCHLWFVFFFSPQLWCSKTFHICFSLTPQFSFSFNFSFYSCFKGKPSMCGIGKIIIKGIYMKWHSFLELITWFCFDALIKTILPHEEIIQVANLSLFCLHVYSLLDCSHVCTSYLFKLRQNTVKIK